MWSRLSLALMFLPLGQLGHLVGVSDSTLELPSFLFGSDPTKCRQWSSEISLHVDKISSASCGSFVGRNIFDANLLLRNPESISSSDPWASWVWSTVLMKKQESCSTAVLKKEVWSLKSQELSVSTLLDCHGTPCMSSVQAPAWSVNKTGWFHVVYTSLRPFCPHVPADAVTHPARQQFPTSPSNFGEPVQIVASASCSQLTGEAPGLALWWFGSAILRFWRVVRWKLSFITVFCIPLSLRSSG